MPAPGTDGLHHGKGRGDALERRERPMIHRRGLPALLLAAFCGCFDSGTGRNDSGPAPEAGRQAAVDPPPDAAGPATADEDAVVTVIAETKYYVVGIPGEENLELLQSADPKRAWDVTGFVLEVVRPPEYAGKIITMHHDGFLASGDPFRLWEASKRYEFRISKSSIGRFDFGPCSLGGARQVVAK
jgi:hypothetical protein